MGSKILRRIPIVLSVLAAVLIFLSGAMPYWTSTDDGTYTVNTGLWKTCTDTADFNTCVAIQVSGTEQVKLDVVRAFLIIAFVSVLLAILTGILLTFDATQGFLAYVAMGLDLFGVVCLAVAVGVYASMAVDNDNKRDLHASFGLAIVAMVIGLVAALFSCCCAREKPEKVT